MEGRGSRGFFFKSPSTPSPEGRHRVRRTEAAGTSVCDSACPSSSAPSLWTAFSYCPCCTFCQQPTVCCKTRAVRFVSNRQSAVRPVLYVLSATDSQTRAVRFVSNRQSAVRPVLYVLSASDSLQSGPCRTFCQQPTVSSHCTCCTFRLRPTVYCHACATRFASLRKSPHRLQIHTRCTFSQLPSAAG